MPKPQNHWWLLVLTLSMTTGACRGDKQAKRVEGTKITTVWTDDFERSALGPNYHATTENYRLVNGALNAKGAYNHPLWLTKKLPRDVQIEFDCWSNSPSGDIKVELFGDGKSHAPTKDKVAYRATGYVAILGGWGNSRSLLARRDEHGDEVTEHKGPAVEVGRHYHWKLVRKGNTLRWFVDDMNEPFLELVDKAPLEGTGQEYFGINNWESDTWFDNLTITPL